MPTVTAVIVHHANLQDTLPCIDSLLQSTRVPDTIIVIDNSNAEFKSYLLNDIETDSLTDSLHRLTFTDRDNCRTQSIRWLQTPNNGYAAALNQGIRSVVSDYYWLLNNDVVVTKEALQHLMLFAESPTSKRVGITGCKLLFHDRPDVINAVGGSFSKWKAGGYNIGANQKDNGQFNTAAVKIDYAYGAAMFVSREYIDNVGLLDESFFLYFEELDWALRGAKAGYNIAYCSGCVVYHKQGASTGKQIRVAHSSLATARLQYGNLLEIYRKHFPSLMLVPYLRLTLLWLKRLKQGRRAEATLIRRIIFGV